jgi:hypothetical protein
MLGTNDCKTAYDTTPEKIGKGVEKLIDQIQSYDANIKILLVSPIELGDGVWETGYDTEFDRSSVGVSRGLPQVYRELAEGKNVEFLAASQYAAPSEADREHMDKINHRNFANAIINKLENMITRQATNIVYNRRLYEKCS